MCCTPSAGGRADSDRPRTQDAAKSATTRTHSLQAFLRAKVDLERKLDNQLVLGRPKAGIGRSTGPLGFIRRAFSRLSRR